MEGALAVYILSYLWPMWCVVQPKLKSWRALDDPFFIRAPFYSFLYGPERIDWEWRLLFILSSFVFLCAGRIRDDSTFLLDTYLVVHTCAVASIRRRDHRLVGEINERKRPLQGQVGAAAAAAPSLSMATLLLDPFGIIEGNCSQFSPNSLIHIVVSHGNNNKIIR
jgi:hypothetical protein